MFEALTEGSAALVLELFIDSAIDSAIDSFLAPPPVTWASTPDTRAVKAAFAVVALLWEE
jgi:hypothetical protein